MPSMRHQSTMAPLSVMGLMVGVVVTHRRTEDGFDFSDAERRLHICVPGEVTAGQWTLVVAKYLKENPKHLHQGMASLVYATLLSAYPCPATPIRLWLGCSVWLELKSENETGSFVRPTHVARSSQQCTGRR